VRSAVTDLSSGNSSVFMGSSDRTTVVYASVISVPSLNVSTIFVPKPFETVAALREDYVTFFLPKLVFSSVNLSRYCLCIQPQQ